MTEPGGNLSGAHREASDPHGPGSGPSGVRSEPSATGAKAAAVGLWIVVAASLTYGVSQALMTAGKLFG